MRYLPKSDEERRAMLAEIGAASIDDLFASIPAEYRITRDLEVPRQQAEGLRAVKIVRVNGGERLADDVGGRAVDPGDDRGGDTVVVAGGPT